MDARAARTINHLIEMTIIKFPYHWTQILNRGPVLTCLQCNGVIISGDECWIKGGTAVCVACSEKYGEGVLPAQAVPTPSSVSDHVDTPPSKQSGECDACGEECGPGAPLSDCCSSATMMHMRKGDDGGRTYFYTCDKCRKECEVYEPTPPKAEGVGEWAEIFASDEQYRKDNGLPLEVPENGHDEYLHVRGEVIRDALTSAVRAAEERKDGEIRGIVDAARKLGKVLWDTMPFFTKEVGAADLELRKLLPPPPDLSAEATAEEDKPTQP